MNAEMTFNKKKLETLIVSHGGMKVQNPSEKTTHIIAAHCESIIIKLDFIYNR